MVFVGAKTDRSLSVAEHKASRLHLSAITMVPWVCPVCGSAERKILLEEVSRWEGVDPRSAYWRNQRCAMVSLDPMPDWAEFRRVYEEICRELELEKIHLCEVRPIARLRGRTPVGPRSSRWLGKFFHIRVSFPLRFVQMESGQY